MLTLCVEESLAHVSSPGPMTTTVAFLQSALNRPGFLTVLPHLLIILRFLLEQCLQGVVKTLVEYSTLKPGVDKQNGKSKTNHSNIGPDRSARLFQRATSLLQYWKTVNEVLQNKLQESILLQGHVSELDHLSMHFPLWHSVIWSCLLSRGVWSDWNWKEKYLIFLNSQTFKVQPVPWILRMQLEVFKQDLYWYQWQAFQTKHPQSNKHSIHQIWLRLLIFFFLSI